MEVVIFIALLLIIILLVNSKSDLSREIKSLSRKLDQMRSELDNLSKSTRINQGPVAKEIPAEPKPIIVPDIKTPTPVPVVKEEIKPKPVPVPTPVKRPPVSKPKEKKPSFFEQHPDLEKFIGENLINKIGIAILVLGIGFFVKYAIDQEWINETGRVFIGILCGGILIGLAHKLRNSYKAFSSVLVGGGLAVFYFTIAIAFHEYHIFSQTAAFLIMVVITGFAVVLSIAYNRMELAVLAIVGGFSSPFMVSTGEGNYIVLFTYILILNTGMLVLAYFKKWNLINIVSYVFTVILYGGWLIAKVQFNDQAPTVGALIFATLFYLIFFLMNIVNNIRENRKFIISEISILLSNTFLYYTAGMIILDNIHEGIYKGLFTALIAIFNFLFAYTLYKNKKVDSNLVYLLIGLVLTFISLSAPVQLKGNNITLFWSAEAVLLLWLSQKSGIKLIKLASMVVMGLMCISLIMDWNNVYGQYDPLTIILNKGFVTSIVSLTSIGLTLILIKKEEDFMIYSFPKEIYRQILTSVFIVFLYITGLLELTFQLKSHIEPNSFRSIITGSYNFSFILGLMLLNKKSKELQIAGVLLGMLTGVIFMAYYHWQNIDLRMDYLYSNVASLGNFIYHYIDTLLVLAILFLTLKQVNNLFGLKSGQGKAFLWYLTFAVLFISSAELDHLVVLMKYNPDAYTDNILSQNHKIGFPILWGLCSFLLMVQGMKRKIKDLRIISLTLFAIILFKLFAFDLRNINTGGKIAAFICLGILLLVVSFMYQKLKKLVMEDETKPATEL